MHLALQTKSFPMIKLMLAATCVLDNLLFINAQNSLFNLIGQSVITRECKFGMNKEQIY